MRLVRLIVAAGVLGPAAPALAEPLSALLGRLAPPAPPEGSVEVVSWIEDAATGSELVVTFVPKGQVKLVADPGVTVTPISRDGLTWSADTPVSSLEPGKDYFTQAPTVRLPFTSADGRPVEAAVDYAYCLVDYQCLFGQTQVSALPPPRG
jgi:hypothetical protein